MNIKTIVKISKERRGGVALTFALMLPVMIGISGLVFEYGSAVLVRAQNQSIADSAAFAAAIAYNATGQDEDAMQEAADRIGALNNRAGATFVARLIPSPANALNNAVEVTVTETVPLVLSRLFTSRTELDVPVVAVAELVAQASNCITAIDPGDDGIVVSGGTSIQATNCGVASNADVEISNCGPYIMATSLTYDSAMNVPGNCGGAPNLRKADGTRLNPQRRPVIDPYGGTPAVTGATARLASVTAMSLPANPAVTVTSGGGAVSFAYNNASTIAQAAANGCIASRAGSVWSYNCPAGGSSTIGQITIGGGIQLRLNPGGNATNVLNINGSFRAEDRMTFGAGTFNLNGSYTGGYGGTYFTGAALNVTGFVNVGTSGTVSFGSGTYNIAQGLYLPGSATTTFGTGTFNIGRGTTACSGGLYSICANSSGGTTFGAGSTFNLSAGVRAGGGATVALGSGSGNTYNIGTSSDGYAFRGDGGSKTSLGDSSGAIRFAGHVNLTGGGSCLVVGTAGQHDIKGNLWGTGAMKLGAGIYTITGSVNFGGSGGGNTSCGGSNIGVHADNVTFVIGATGTLATSGVCAGRSFCLAAGYSSVLINASNGGSTAGFAVIGPTVASNNAGGNFTSGATNTAINGVFYMPNGDLEFSGAGALGSPGGCLEILGKSIDVSAGGLLGSECIATGGATNLAVRLVR